MCAFELVVCPKRVLKKCQFWNGLFSTPNWLKMNFYVFLGSSPALYRINYISGTSVNSIKGQKSSKGQSSDRRVIRQNSVSISEFLTRWLRTENQGPDQCLGPQGRSVDLWKRFSEPWKKLQKFSMNWKRLFYQKSLTKKITRALNPLPKLIHFICKHK